MPRWGDIKTLNAENFYERTGLRTVDLVSGSPPCQPFSVAGKQRGKADDRYLWPEMYRIIREIQPAWVLLEEVTGFIPMALDTVLSDLESAEYASQSFVIPACGVNAPHQRYRLCVVAHAIHGSGAMRRHRELQNAQIHAGSGDHHRGRTPELLSGEWREHEPGIAGVASRLRTLVDGCPSPDADCNRLEGWQQLPLLDAAGMELFTECSCREREREREREPQGIRRGSAELDGSHALGPSGADECGIPGVHDGLPDWLHSAEHFWDDGEPEGLERIKRDVPNRKERIQAIGNAIPPQQFYPFYKTIMEELRREEEENGKPVP